MPAVSAIVINDGQTTPIAHTFTPTRSANSPSTFVFEDRAAGIKAGYNTIRYESRINQSTGALHQKVVISVPRLATTAPASGTGIQPNPTRAYTELLTIESVRPSALEVNVANDCWAFLKNLVANAQFQSWLKDGDQAF